MAQNSAMELQRDIKNNADELQAFLKDLKNWEKDMKAVDEGLAGQPREANNDIPPVRCKKKIETTVKKGATPERRRKGERKDKIKAYDYAAWDKFDADKAMESDEEEKSKAASKKQSKQERAIALKEEGNRFYSSGRIEDAIAMYSRAIGLDPANAVLPANRAMAYIKLEKYTAAEADCNKCLKLDGNYIKAYLRRGTCRLHLRKPDQAAQDFLKVLELEPWNKEAKKELEKLERNSDKKRVKERGEGKKNNKVKVVQDNKENNEKKNATTEPTNQTTTQPTNETTTQPTTEPTTQPTNETTIQPTTEPTSELTNETINQPTTEPTSQSTNETINQPNPRQNSGIKKLRIQEVDSSQTKVDSDVIIPINKPPHLRSQTPLKNIKVIDVESYDSIEALQKSSSNTNQKEEPTRTTEEPKPAAEEPSQASQEPKETREPTPEATREANPKATGKTTQEASGEAKPVPDRPVVVPAAPKTSHQFSQDWARMLRQSCAVEYLKKIPLSFFSSVELETEVLVSVAAALGGLGAGEAGGILAALAKSSGFSVNVMFCDDDQRKVLMDVVARCESEGDFAAEAKKIRAMLN